MIEALSRGSARWLSNRRSPNRFVGWSTARKGLFRAVVPSMRLGAMREQVLPNAELELLEPIVRLEVEVPSGFQGGVVGHLTRKRSVFSSSQDSGEVCRIQAQVPLAEMLDYANELRSATRGQGSYTMVPDGYHYVPVYIAFKLFILTAIASVRRIESNRSRPFGPQRFFCYTHTRQN